MKKWYQSKTIWAGLTGVFTGGAMIYTGNVVLGITTALGGLQSIFIRDAIEKNKHE